MPLSQPSFTKGAVMQTITLPLAANGIPVQIIVSGPVPTGTEPAVNDAYLRHAKSLIGAIERMPSGVTDRLLWLWLGKELDAARDCLSFDPDGWHRRKVDTLYAAWEVLNTRVNPTVEHADNATG